MDTNKEMICFGDSLVFGYKISHKSKWTTMINGYKGWHVTNRGVCREATYDFIRRFDTEVLEKHPDMLMFLGGCNDIFQQYSIKEALPNIEKMVCKALDEGISVILTIPCPIVYPYEPEFWTREVDFSKALPLLSELCNGISALYNKLVQEKDYESKLHLADLKAAFESVVPIEDYYLDELHPNAPGQEIIAKEIRRFM